MGRLLRDIAADIDGDWRVINNTAALQALGHMKGMGSIDEPFFGDPSGYGVVGSFLEHSRGWQGPVAQRIKKELRIMCGHPRP